MPTPENARVTGGRLTGQDMCLYMETFADNFLKGGITFDVEVENISRGSDGVWSIKTRNLKHGSVEVLQFNKVVLCTGVSISQSYIPLKSDGLR
jgi:cation diffusion facilitator CzcD-associated flavoprotein CzcO